jgi:RNA polymerase sigma-70 factor, ECF subfamily
VWLPDSAAPHLRGPDIYRKVEPVNSAADSASSAAGHPAGAAERLPAPEPIDLQRVEARQEEAIEFATLIGQIARGDQEALGVLYDNSSDRIYGLLLRILRSPEAAAKVTEEVFVEVWRQARRYRPSDGTVFAWMVAIAHQRAIDKVAAPTEETAADRPAASGTITREIDEVWAVIEQRFSSARVRAGLKALDFVQRQVLLLAYFEGFSQKQLAAQLDIPLHSVRVQMRDGLFNLRRALGVSDG